jgi:hypothetical protein
VPLLTLKLDVPPEPQRRRLWPELSGVSENFELYGGTALAPHLGHRASAHFGFFSNEAFDPDLLPSRMPFLNDAERIQIAANTNMPDRTERARSCLLLWRTAAWFRSGAGPVCGYWLKCGLAARHRWHQGRRYPEASGDKRLSRHRCTTAKRHGSTNPSCCRQDHLWRNVLKALSYFDDVPDLPNGLRELLTAAVASTDPIRLPKLSPYRERPPTKVQSREAAAAHQPPESTLDDPIHFLGTS